MHLFAYQSYTYLYCSVIYTMYLYMAICVKLQPKILPKSTEFENNIQTFWEAIIDVLEIEEVLKKIKNVSESAPQVAQQHKIDELILLLEKVKVQAGVWVRHSQNKYTYIAIVFPGVSFVSLHTCCM